MRMTIARVREVLDRLSLGVGEDARAAAHALAIVDLALAAGVVGPPASPAPDRPSVK